jgi:hypothetical protein
MAMVAANKMINPTELGLLDDIAGCIAGNPHEVVILAANENLICVNYVFVMNEIFDLSSNVKINDSVHPEREAVEGFGTRPFDCCALRASGGILIVRLTDGF